MNELTPFRDFNNDLFSVFDRLQSELFKTFNNPRSLIASMDQSAYPKMNIKQKEKDLVFEIALPSYHPEDVEVSLNGDILTIAGKISSDYANDNDAYLIREVSHRAFSRSWKLPKPTTDDKIEANYDRGVLHLVIKDVVESSPEIKRIPVKINKHKDQE